jgi:hypothetical protein
MHCKYEGYYREHVPSPLKLEVRLVGHPLLLLLILVIIALNGRAVGRRGEGQSEKWHWEKNVTCKNMLAR